MIQSASAPSSSADVGRVARIAGLFAMLVGAAALSGWILRVDWLKGAGGSIMMKPNAALGLLACGVSLRRLAGAKGGRAWVAIGCALLAGALGGLTLVEHLVGWNIGIDELLFIEPPGAVATSSPARMGLNASVSLMLAATALVSLRRRPIASQVLAFTMSVLATIPLVGYLYGAEELYSIARYTGVAWHTAGTLLVISIGILMARTDVGPMAALVGHDAGGIMARRLLLPALLIPVMLGYARVLGQRAGLYDTGLGTALFVIAVTVMITVLISRTALALDDLSRARAAAQQERDTLLVQEQAARAAAERANRVKDEFLAMLSHELRTPLNVIVGWTDLVRSNAVAVDRRTHAAEVIARNSRLLTRLVEDLLDVSRLTTGQVQLNVQPVDLSRVAAAAVDAMADRLAEKDICITTELDATALVAGDAERLQQIAGNLLSNAVKFTPRKGRIDVTTAIRGGGVELTVSDSGQGIHPEFLPHVFERFRQEDATVAREHGGLGLGLAIVRELTELHGGSVKAFSDGPGRGSSFTVWLPLLDASTAATSGLAAARGYGEGFGRP